MSRNVEITAIPRGAYIARVRSALASAVFTSALVLTAGCSAGGDIGTGPSNGTGDTDVAGTYDLAAVNGDPVPQLILEYDTGFEILRSYILSGQVVLRPDSTYSIAVTWKRDKMGGGTATETLTSGGTYSYASSSGVVTLSSSSGGTATVLATQISLTYETKIPSGDGQRTLIWVYVRP